MKVSLIIPCYNESENIKMLYEKIINSFKKEKKIILELIFINDGSKDKTLNELKQLLKHKENNIKIIDFSRNFGKEAAIFAGINNSSGDYISIIDADLQQSPDIILNMINILEKNNDYDCVAAFQDKRKENKIISLLKKIFYKIINKVTDVDFVSGASDFRTFRKTVAKSLLEIKEKNRFSKGIFSWVGYNTYYIPYTVEKRYKGKSKWSLTKLFKYAMDGIISFSTTPLKIIFYIGLFLMIFSIFMFVMFILKNFSINIYFKIIILLITFIGGIILMSLGIIGEYIGRIFSEVKNRPIYITKNIFSNEKTTANEEK